MKKNFSVRNIGHNSKMSDSFVRRHAAINNEDIHSIHNIGHNVKMSDSFPRIDSESNNEDTHLFIILDTLVKCLIPLQEAIVEEIMKTFTFFHIGKSGQRSDYFTRIDSEAVIITFTLFIILDLMVKCMIHFQEAILKATRNKFTLFIILGTGLKCLIPFQKALVNAKMKTFLLFIILDTMVKCLISFQEAIVEAIYKDIHFVHNWSKANTSKPFFDLV